MKTILRLLLFLCIPNINAQTNNQNFEALKEEIAKSNPNIDFKDKLVFISTWKSTDFESREINKEAHRVYKIYEKAKLKNGEKGVVFISINLDTEDQNRVFAIGKDNLEPSVVYSGSNLLENALSILNTNNSKSIILLDKNGVLQFSNMPKDEIFSSLRSLIVR